MEIGINIPKRGRPSNGDVIKTLFPAIEAERRDDVVDVYGLSSFSVTFKQDWWDAPYVGSKLSRRKGNNNEKKENCI